MTEEQKQGLSRREVLKKGAMLGGTVLWVVPVVQAVGMSPAMAQVPSEGTCCLRVDVSATAVDHNSDGNVNDIQVDFTGTNCGSTPLTHVDLLLEVSDDDGSHWSSAATSLNGNPNPGQQTGTTYFLTNPGAGSYLFRLSGEYDCLKSVDLPHNVPTGYATAGPVVISS